MTPQELVSENKPARLPGWIGPLARQMRHGWALAILLVTALSGVVALHAYVLNSSCFQTRSMQLIMKDMGHNLWFMDSSANLLDIVSGSADAPALSDKRVHELAADRAVASTYWVNILQARTVFRDRDVLLTGLEVVDDHQVTEEKDHLLDPLAPGTAALGHALARDWGLEPGDLLAINGRDYQVQTVHTANGTLDDTRLWVPLADAQERLDRPGEANLILGFLCMRGLPLHTGVQKLEEHMRAHHSDLQVVPLMNILQARALSRITTTRYLDYLLYAVMAVTGALIAALGWMEVSERRYELAVLTAMGAGQAFVVFFFLAKLALLAVVAAVLGFLIGSFASVHWLSDVLVVHTRPVSVTWSDFPVVLFRVLAMVAVAAAIPAIRLVRLDPVRILAEE